MSGTRRGWSDRWIRWNRSERWVLSGVVWACLVAVVVLGVALPLAGVAGLAGGGVRVPVTLEERADVPAEAAGGGVALEGTREGELVIADPTVTERALAEAPEVLGGLLAVAVLVLLLRIAATFRAGDAFAPGNAGRLAVVAVLVIVGAVALPPLGALTIHLLAASAPAVDAAMVTGFTLPLAPMLAAMLVGALAEAFRYGAKLREDTEGLV